MLVRIVNWSVAGCAFAAAFIITAVVADIVNPLPYVFTNGTTADATQVNADFAQIVANVNTNALPASSYVPFPAGAVVAFKLAACPAGWIAADGTASTADMRGNFVRGLDTSGAVDPGRTLNTLQLDQLQDHTHPTTTPDGSVATGPGAINAGAIGNDTGNPDSGRHGTETRPRNIALLYCQKS